MESLVNNELKRHGRKVTLCNVNGYDESGRTRKKVVMICFEVLSKHLLDGLPEYEALHIFHEVTDEKCYKHEC